MMYTDLSAVIIQRLKNIYILHERKVDTVKQLNLTQHHPKWQLINQSCLASWPKATTPWSHIVDLINVRMLGPD